MRYGKRPRIRKLYLDQVCSHSRRREKIATKIIYLCEIMLTHRKSLTRFWPIIIDRTERMIFCSSQEGTPKNQFTAAATTDTFSSSYFNLLLNIVLFGKTENDSTDFMGQLN